MSTVPSRQEYLRRWSALHGGLTVNAHESRIVYYWLSGVYLLARGAAALRLSATAVTILSLVCAALVPVTAWWLVSGGSNAGAAALCAGFVVLAGLLDNLDGAVAVLRGTTGPWGAWLDGVVDRLADTVVLLTLGVLGGLWVVVGVQIGLAWLTEYARAKAQAGGELPITSVSISERPTRIIVVVAAILLFAWAPYGVASTTWAEWITMLGAGLAAIGTIQVLVGVGLHVRRDGRGGHGHVS